MKIYVRIIISIVLIPMCLTIGPVWTAQGAELLAPVPDAPVTLEVSAGVTQLAVQGWGTINVPGQPRLPARIVALAIPPGAEVESVEVHSSRHEILAGSHTVAPVTLRLPLKTLNAKETAVFQAEYDQQYASVYSHDALWPETIGRFQGRAAYRQYQLVDILVTPIQYNPVTGQLVHHRDITINVVYSVSTPVQSAYCTDPRMEANAKRIILNYDDAQQWYPTAGSPSRGLYDMVIITTDALQDSVQSLIAFESNVKGQPATVVTVETIDASVTGTDLAQKMRTFLRQHYPSDQWGFQDVLLVGHHSDVPMRQVEQDLEYGKPLTDFYFAELSNPDNVSWDSNENGQYWDNQDAADYYSEVTVGRIPWSDPARVEAICARSMQYEMNDEAAFKKNILLLGSFFWENTDNAVLMEYIMAQPHMADWSSIRMYEQNSTVYSVYPCDYELRASNVEAVWPTGQFAFANLAGHGSYQSVHIMGYGSEAFWASSWCDLLSNTYPAIVFSDACSTSDTSYTNLGQRMLENGAVGYVGATKVALGSGGWQSPADGSSQTLDYFFTEAVTSGEYSQGAAHQYGLTETYQLNGFGYAKYEIAEWNLWGNPNLGMGFVIGSDGALALDAEEYPANGVLQMTVRDIDISGLQGSLSVTITTSASDSETVQLTEMPDSRGVFAGSILLAESQARAGNKRLDVLHGQTVTVTYVDADDGQGGTNVIKSQTVTIDGIEPVITHVHFGRISSDRVEVSFSTSEPAACVIEFGKETLDRTADAPIPTTDHTITLNDLTPCTYYFFIIRASDVAGNETVDDNDGIYFRVNTHSVEPFFTETLTVDPGWITEGMWEFGQPLGQGGDHGHADPISGYTGPNVYGYNLAGDYPDNSAAFSLTTQAIDCSSAENVMLNYRRWLGVERSSYDHAS
ncbi:hypothetical protein JXA80_07900, partial [bacterium]|nr:hypothetical protein [candidate division CSSED10-310 bacterium]